MTIAIISAALTAAIVVPAYIADSRATVDEVALTEVAS